MTNVSHLLAAAAKQNVSLDRTGVSWLVGRLLTRSVRSLAGSYVGPHRKTGEKL